MAKGKPVWERSQKGLGAARPPAAAQDAADERELAAAEAKAAERGVIKDKVARLLECGWMMTNRTWGWFTRRDPASGEVVNMYVTQLFDKGQNPNLEHSIAVDKFMTAQAMERADVALRRRLLNEHGIKYAVLHPGKVLADVLVQVEEQSL